MPELITMTEFVGLALSSFGLGYIAGKMLISIQRFAEMST